MLGKNGLGILNLASKMWTSCLQAIVLLMAWEWAELAARGVFCSKNLAIDLSQVFMSSTLLPLSVASASVKSGEEGGTTTEVSAMLCRIFTCVTKWY